VTDLKTRSCEFFVEAGTKDVAVVRVRRGLRLPGPRPGNVRSGTWLIGNGTRNYSWSAWGRIARNLPHFQVYRSKLRACRFPFGSNQCPWLSPPCWPSQVYPRETGAARGDIPLRWAAGAGWLPGQRWQTGGCRNQKNRQGATIYRPPSEPPPSFFHELANFTAKATTECRFSSLFQRVCDFLVFANSCTWKLFRPGPHRMLILRRKPISLMGIPEKVAFRLQ